VTTEVIGNCGSSWATVPDPAIMREIVAPYVLQSGGGQLEDIRRIPATAGQAGLGLNVAPLVGHGSLRVAAMGYDATSNHPG